MKSKHFLPRIRFYKSANRGTDLERFAEHRMPSGKELSKIYSASASKRVYFRFAKAGTGKNLNFSVCTSQFGVGQYQTFHSKVRYLRMYAALNIYGFEDPGGQGCKSVILPPKFICWSSE